MHFKNLIKKGWDNAEGATEVVIAQPERGLIKNHLAELMCTVPPSIQAQCSKSISLIAAVDFPNKWDNLLPKLSGKFDSTDPFVVSGVLVTINAILRRFRYVKRSDEMYSDILYALERL